MAVKPRLWTRGFILDTLVNFLIYIIYYMLVVIIASEAISSLNATVSEAGLAAGIFVLGTLAARLAGPLKFTAAKRCSTAASCFTW